jgi:hypothetical protein
MIGLGRFLPLTRIGVSKNYMRNDVIRVKNCFATLLANINTLSLSAMTDKQHNAWGKSLSWIRVVGTTDYLTLEAQSPLNWDALLFRAVLLINCSFDIRS